MEQITSICDMVGQYMQKKKEEKRIAEEQPAKDLYWKIPICYDDDDDYTIAITPVVKFTRQGVTVYPLHTIRLGNPIILHWLCNKRQDTNVCDQTTRALLQIKGQD
ncbi:hypothetical protein Tco_0187860 [Tanacetum coccineum]